MKQSEVGKYKTTDDLKNLKSIAIEGGSAGEKAAQAPVSPTPWYPTARHWL